MDIFFKLICAFTDPFQARSSSSGGSSSGSGGGSGLSSMLGGGGGAIPQTLDQLLERQWEQGSQFLMEQAQHFDIASLLSCLHQLRAENSRLEDRVSSLLQRRDHLLAVNARLAIPLTGQAGVNVQVGGTPPGHPHTGEFCDFLKCLLNFSRLFRRVFGLFFGCLVCFVCFSIVSGDSGIFLVGLFVFYFCFGYFSVFCVLT